jgi:hypothetical protein
MSQLLLASQGLCYLELNGISKCLFYGKKVKLVTFLRNKT